ncbi:sulfatase-like hydrolase/transferase [bacterium]|nr:sulfatase-like hydrolase/transferase [bacterium]
MAGTGGLFLSKIAGENRCCAAENGASHSPNIVLIISDDQSWKDYSFMGHPTIQTPHLDRLASDSVVFTRGYVAAPLCCPSLASMVTGLHPHQHKITSNDPPFKGKGPKYSSKKWPEERRQLRQKMMGHINDVPTLPDLVKKKGYNSLQTGKWWAGHYRQGGFTHGMTHGDIDRGGRHGDEGLKIGRETMQPIYDFIDEDRNQPFFMWYAPFLPHTPHNPPERLLKKYRDKTDSIHIAKYWANCEWFDETCGELLNYLDEKNLTENTIVLYVCDNGWIQKPNQRGYAERSKRTPYEGGIRTPIMVKWPGHIKPRMDTTTPVSAVDLAPTILHACGLEPTDPMQGKSLLNRDALKKRDAVCGAAYTHDAVDIEKPITSLKYTYIIAGEWKLIQPSGRNETGTTPELYNVMDDPDENHDLAAANPQKVAHLQTQLKSWWEKAVPE